MEEAGSNDARFDALFSGLEAQARAAQAADDDIAAAEAERAAWSEVDLLDRLRATGSVVIEVADHGPVGGLVIEVGSDVIVIEADDGQWAIPRWGIVAAIGTGDTVESPSAVGSRLGFAALAREWSAQRSIVRVMRRGGAPLDGTIDRVASDHLDLAEHDPGVPRRPAEVRRSLALPFGVITAMRRR